jgi:hypothetical protein
LESNAEAIDEVTRLITSVVDKIRGMRMTRVGTVLTADTDTIETYYGNGESLDITEG